jgi:serine protease Do
MMLGDQPSPYRKSSPNPEGTNKDDLHSPIETSSGDDGIQWMNQVEEKPCQIVVPETPSDTSRVTHQQVPVLTGPNSLSPAVKPGPSVSVRRAVWVLMFGFFLVVINLWVPHFAQRMQYASSRGKLLAEYEVAQTALKDNPLASFSYASQMVGRRVGPSVVHINTSNVRAHAEEDQLGELFGPYRREAEGQGSGVIMDKEGYLLTNYHVIQGSNDIRVTLSDGRQLPGVVVGTDALTDLAVIKLDAPDLLAAEWADSDKTEVGSVVWAVGSPFGLDQSVTMGILSAKHRAGLAGTAYQDFLQTDAAVNPGNSGGPLVDAQGNVVGINTAIVGNTFQGISFAVPSSVAQKVFERIRDHGSVMRGWLGTALEDVDEERRKLLGLPSRDGALVSDVVDDDTGRSPAREGGLKVGDFVQSWNGQEITSRSQLSQLVGETPVASVAEVTVIRGDEKITLNVVIGKRPARFN